MLTPFDLDQRVVWHQEDLLREAEQERLAKQLRSRGSLPRVRARVAALLYALANRLEPSREGSGLRLASGGDARA